MRLLPLVAMAAVVVSGCGSSSTAAPTTVKNSASPCPAASPGARLTVLRGSGSTTTDRFTACGRWVADLDWTCGSATGSIDTTVAWETGVEERGPRGDGTAGMNLLHLAIGGPARIRVTASADCNWSIDILQG